MDRMAQHRPFLRPEEIGRSAASVVRGPIEKTGLIRSSVVRMAGYTPGEQPAETGVIKLNTNENPYPPSPLVARALREMDAARLRLYPDPLCKELRRRIAGMHGCSPEQVFIGNGSDEILSLATRAFVEDTGKIGYFVPSYSLYPVLAAARGAASAPVELGPRVEWTMP
jgi:histidinol-phosphate aminotransferase